MKTCVLLLSLAFISRMQPALGQPAAPSSTLEVERRFTLSIRDTVINRDDLFAETALVLAPTAAQKASVYAGATVRARQAEIRLRGIEGEVYFRASLGRLSFLQEPIRRTTQPR